MAMYVNIYGKSISYLLCFSPSGICSGCMVIAAATSITIFFLSLRLYVSPLQSTWYNWSDQHSQVRPFIFSLSPPSDAQERYFPSIYHLNSNRDVGMIPFAHTVFSPLLGAL